MAISDYMPDFSDPNSMAAWGALGNVLIGGSAPRYAPNGNGITGGNKLNSLAALAGMGMTGAVQGADGAQEFQKNQLANQQSQVMNPLAATAQDQANQMKNFDLMFYRRQNGLDPNTGQPVTSDQAQSIQPGANIQTPYGGVPSVQSAQIPQVNASALPAPVQGSGQPIPMPQPPGSYGLPPTMAKNSGVYGAMGGINPSMLTAPAMAASIGPMISYNEKMLETGKSLGPNGISVLPGATDAAAAMSNATEQGKVGPTNTINATKIALENKSAKDIEDHKNYLEFGDNGLGGSGSIKPALSASGSNGGAPIPSPHGTIIPDVTEQTPIMKDANSLKTAIPAWQEKATEINNSIAPAQKAQVQLGAIANALKQTQAGSFATNKATMKAALDSVGIKLPASVWGDPAAVQVALHGAQLETLNDLKSANSRFSTMEFKTITANKENPNTQPAANLEFIAQDMGTINQQLALANDWRSAQKIGWRNPQDFSSAWMTANPQSRFVAGAKSKIGLLKGMQSQ